ncbi:MAG: FAD-dependent oxidoreductase [Ilumatobacteraceae bacterium]
MLGSPLPIPLWDRPGGPTVDDPTRRGPGPLPSTADVVIVGAGFTGLWTAHHLRRQDPGCDIVVLEARRVGFGASGRNGGWCSALLPMAPAGIAARHGRDAAIRSVTAMRETVVDVGRTIEELGIECGWAHDGTLTVARNAAQAARLRAGLDADRALGLDEGDRWIDAAPAAGIVGATGTIGATFTPHCAAIDPGRLVRGLARSCVDGGVRIFEGHTVTRIEPGSVDVADPLGGRHTIHAGTVVRATEAYTARIPGLRRRIAPVYSLMIATERVPADVLDAIPWTGRPTFSDGRRMIVYAQRTEDDRIAFGGRGAPYHFGSSIADAFDHHLATHRLLVASLHELFPPLRDVRIAHRWGGPLGVPRDWICSVGHDRTRRLAWAGGYVGDGVGTSYLSGRMLASSITGIDDPVLTLPWFGHHSPDWEPEPVRWAAIRAAGRLTRWIDAVEHRGGRAPRSSALLDRLTGH